MRLPGKKAIRPANSTASRPHSVQIHFRRTHERPPPQQRKPGNLESDKRTPAYCDPATLGTPSDVPNFSAAPDRDFADRNPFPGAPRRYSRRTESEQLPSPCQASPQPSWPLVRDSPSHSDDIVPQRTSSAPELDMPSISVISATAKRHAH